MDAGKQYGIRHCGYYAMHAVRIEKVMKYACCLILETYPKLNSLKWFAERIKLITRKVSNFNFML